MSIYNKQIELNYLEKIAAGDYVSARILWNLNIFLPSLHLLHESIEKYIKILWAKNEEFSDKEELEKKFKDFGHDFNKIFNKLPSEHQNQLKICMEKNGFRLYFLEGLRYGSKTAAVMYDETLFRGAELFIKEIRLLLGRKLKKNILEEFKIAAYPIQYNKQNKRLLIFKDILGLPRVSPSKKEKKSLQKQIELYLSGIK